MAMTLRVGRDRSGRCLLEVWIVPKASRDAVIGEREGALRVSVTAPPVEGAANKALCALIAKRLGLPKGAVQVERGHRGRRKTLSIEGADREAVLALG